MRYRKSANTWLECCVKIKIWLNPFTNISSFNINLVNIIIFKSIWNIRSGIRMLQFCVYKYHCWRVLFLKVPALKLNLLKLYVYVPPLLIKFEVFAELCLITKSRRQVMYIRIKKLSCLLDCWSFFELRVTFLLSPLYVCILILWVHLILPWTMISINMFHWYCRYWVK